MILSIDGSFTSSGVTLHKDDGELVDYVGIHEGGKVYSSNKDIHESCLRIRDRICEFCEEVKESLTVVIEIPAPNKSGFYLAILHGWLVSSFVKDTRVSRIVTIPPGACNSYTKNKEKTKSYLVNYAKDKGWIPQKRINNDIATAAILAHCYLDYLEGNYTNKVNIWEV